MIIEAVGYQARSEYMHRHATVAITWSGPTGPETLALVVHGMMGQGGGSFPADLVTCVMRRQLGAPASGLSHASIYSPSQIELAGSAPRAFEGRPQARLAAALELTHQALRAAHQNSMGAAVVAALFAGNEVAFAQIGDCRAFRLRRYHQPFQLTQHHELELPAMRIQSMALGFGEPAIDFHCPALLSEDQFILASPDLLRDVPGAELGALAAEHASLDVLGRELTARATERVEMDHAVVLVRVTGPTTAH